MNTRNQGVSSSLSHSALIRFFVALALLAALSLVMAPAALACHNGKPHGRGVTSCGGGGSQNPPLAIDIATLTDGVRGAADAAFRACTPTADFGPEGGTYACTTDQSVRITTGAMTLSAARKNLDLCNTFQVFSDVGDVSEEYFPDDSSYFVRWTDNCTDGSCGLQATASFSSGISEATGGVSDGLTITMFAQHIHTSTEQTNPFASSLDADVTQIVFDFRKPGSTAVLANCVFYPYQLGDVVLSTFPDPK